jgi:hypothetical protein
MAMMLGWFSDEADFASCTKRTLSFGVGDFLCGQDFDGYLTTEAALDGTVYLTHPSRP